VKQGPWHTPSSDQTSVSVGGPLDISCLYTTYVSTNVYPELSLTLNGRPWSAYSASARVEEVTSGIAPGTKVINGHIDKVEDFMFEIVDYADPYGVLNIECSATVHDMVIKKRDLSLKKESEQNSQSNSQSRPTASNPEYDLSTSEEFRSDSNNNDQIAFPSNNDYHSSSAQQMQPRSHGSSQVSHSEYLLVKANAIDDLSR